MQISIEKYEKVVDEVSPNTIITGAPYTLYEGMKDANIKTLSKYVDVIAMEGLMGLL